MTKTNIIISFQVEGFHCWPDAPKEVAFLRDNHRHMFWIEAEKEVKHDDRDIEIIMFKREIQAKLLFKYGGNNGELILGSKSCEMLAKEILEEFDCERVKVTEDNENGAVVYKVTVLQ